jgi:hypothetical protein
LVPETGKDLVNEEEREEEVQMRKKIAAVMVACGAFFTLAAPALPFTIVNPVTGECRQVLIPGPATFPGNWEVVSATPADGPGPWNGHGHANDNTALGPVLCP